MIESSRPRILLVTRNLPPLVGGMERLNWHMADELSRRAEVCIIGPAGSAALAPAGVRVREVPLRPLWKFLLAAQITALKEARHWRPGWVLAGSGLTALPSLIAARASGARAAVYVHGLDLTVPNPVYRRMWLPALRRMDRVIANSRATAALAAQAGVDQSRIGIVHPGVALPEESPNPEVIVRFRTEYDLGDKPLLLSVGRLSARKGLREFVTKALPKIAAVHPNVVLLIVGDAPKDALHAQAQTPASIREAAKQMEMAGNLKFLGTITDEALDVAYRAASVHVFPIREIAGDPEGFGMVAVEAAAHGLPTVAFATGGVVDAVAEGQSGRLVPPGDYGAFADGVLQMLTQGTPSRAGCIAFAERFAWPAFGKRIVAQLSSTGSARSSTGMV